MVIRVDDDISPEVHSYSLKYSVDLSMHNWAASWNLLLSSPCILSLHADGNFRRISMVQESFLRSSTLICCDLMSILSPVLCREVCLRLNSVWHQARRIASLKEQSIARVTILPALISDLSSMMLNNIQMEICYICQKGIAI